MKSYLFSYISLAAIILLFAFMNSSIIILCFTGAWFVTILASNIFEKQEKNNLDRLYSTVSVCINDIVLGRYIFVFLNYLVSFFSIIFSNFFFILYRNSTFSLVDTLVGFSLSFLVFSAITGVQMPLFFKFGYIKAKMWSLIPFITVILYRKRN